MWNLDLYIPRLHNPKALGSTASTTLAISRASWLIVSWRLWAGATSGGASSSFFFAAGAGAAFALASSPLRAAEPAPP